MIYNKLTDTTKDLFSIISDKAKEYNAINLVQPEQSECPAELINLAQHYISEGYNHYAPPYGVYPLREQIAKKVKAEYARDIDPYKEITITSGANQAVFTTISSFISDEDEVIVFEPAYKSYVPSIQNLGGRPIYVPLKLPDYHIDWTEVQKVISSRTKLLIVNSPHNPTGTILSSEDLVQLKKIVNGTNIRILSDEVFEHFIFGEYEHQSLLQIPELYKRSIIVSSFGKLFNIPGWKIGYCIAPEKLTKEIQKTHTFQINSVNTPLQYAIADYLNFDIIKEGIQEKYEKKRSLVQEYLANTDYEIVETKGTYFQLIKYDKVSNLKDTEFVEQLMKKGVAVFPLSFYYHDFIDNKVIGINFAHPDEELRKGLEILAAFK